MTNRRPQQPTEKALRQTRGVNMASTGSVDIGELLLAEFQARRTRLQQLLRLVWMEVERLPARRLPVRPRAKCGRVGVKHIA